MSATSPHDLVRDDSARVRVRRDELIALRQRVAHASLRRARMASASPAGSQAAHRRGRGMDYLESRVYQPGDDVRHLDWRLTARRGQLHTKVFQEEHEHSVMLLLDTHASMRFGTRERFKSVQAARACAMMAWHVARAGGRVGALAFGPCREVRRATAGVRGALAVCTALANWDASAPADRGADELLSTALQRMQPLARGCSHVVLVTDGYSGDAHMRAALAAWRRHASLSVLLVSDPLETDAPPRGRFPLASGASRHIIDLIDAGPRATFHQTLAAPMRGMQEVCRALGVASVHIDTRSDPMEAITSLLAPVRRGAR